MRPVVGFWCSTTNSCLDVPCVIVKRLREGCVDPEGVPRQATSDQTAYLFEIETCGPTIGRWPSCR